MPLPLYRPDSLCLASPRLAVPRRAVSCRCRAVPHPAVPRPWLALPYLESSSGFTLSHSLSLCYQLTLLGSRGGLLEIRRAASKNKRYVPLTFLAQRLLYGPNKQVAFIALKDNAANKPPPPLPTFPRITFAVLLILLACCVARRALSPFPTLSFSFHNNLYYFQMICDRICRTPKYVNCLDLERHVAAFGNFS